MKSLKQFAIVFFIGIGALSISSFQSSSAAAFISTGYVSPDFEANEANYCVKLAETNSTLSVGLTKKITNINGARGIKKENGTYQFFSPFYGTETEMINAFDSFLQLGFGEAEKMVEYKGVFYTLSEFEAVKSGF